MVEDGRRPSEQVLREPIDFQAFKKRKVEGQIAQANQAAAIQGPSSADRWLAKTMLNALGQGPARLLADIIRASVRKNPKGKVIEFRRR